MQGFLAISAASDAVAEKFSQTAFSPCFTQTSNYSLPSQVPRLSRNRFG